MKETPQEILLYHALADNGFLPLDGDCTWHYTRELLGGRWSLQVILASVGCQILTCKLVAPDDYRLFQYTVSGQLAFSKDDDPLDEDGKAQALEILYGLRDFFVPYAGVAPGTV